MKNVKKKQKEEEDTGILNSKLGKYWRGNIWIGPIMMKHNKSQSTCWKNYMEAVKNNPPASIIIPGKVLYSRDNKNWYNSYQETFTEEGWRLMEEQKQNEAYRRSGIIRRGRSRGPPASATSSPERHSLCGSKLPTRMN